MIERPNWRARNEHGRIKGRRGVAIRKARLARQPLCEDCTVKGLTVIATEVDHIIPLARGGKDTDDNVRSLCRAHHEARTREQFGFKEKSRIGVDGWPIQA